MVLIYIILYISFFDGFPRVAEKVWSEGLLIESFPPESYQIKCLEDSWTFLAKEGAQLRFEEAVRDWMKNIYEVLLESEQLRLETDNAGPQEELEYWKSRAARLSLLVDQVSFNCSCESNSRISRPVGESVTHFNFIIMTS